MRFADPAEATAGAERFVAALLAHGTTSAVVFPTVHKVSADCLFEAASARGMRLVTGKVLMDRHAPAALRDDVEQAERDCIDLIDRWHGRDRLSFAVTVRFAASFSPHAVNQKPLHLAQDVPAGSVMRIGSKLKGGRITLQIAGRAGRDAERIELTPAELALFVGVGQRLLAEIAKS